MKHFMNIPVGKSVSAAHLMSGTPSSSFRRKPESTVPLARWVPAFAGTTEGWKAGLCYDRRTTAQP
jgi:hypothetical protein